MATQSHYAGTAPAQRQGSQTLKWAALAALLGLALVAPFQLYPVFLAKALCFALFACAFNLLIGYVGLLSFGHAAFFGSAAYVTAHAVKVWGLTPELGILLGVATAAAFGLLFGVIAIRRQGIYFAMVTLALSQMVFFLALAAAVHRRRGRHPGGAARHPVRDVRPRQQPGHVLLRAGGVPGRVRADLPDDPLAVRSGAEGDPGERAARRSRSATRSTSTS